MNSREAELLANEITQCFASTQGCKKLPVRMIVELAVGSMKVFRIDEIEGDNGKKRREHVHVTDSEEIKSLLDEHDGGPGVVDGAYYYFSDVLPDNKAIEAMLNRALGKAADKLEIVKPTEAAREAIQRIMDSTGLSEEAARAIVAPTFGISEQELITSDSVM